MGAATRNDPSFTNQVETDAQAAQRAAGFTGTPSFLVGKSGQTLTNCSTYASLSDPTSFNGRS